jgi:hypothetical protein
MPAMPASSRVASIPTSISVISTDYLSADRPVPLTPVASDEFVIAGPGGDRLHIDRDGHGAIVGITINPGPWAVSAPRWAHD